MFTGNSNEAIGARTVAQLGGIVKLYSFNLRARDAQA